MLDSIGNLTLSVDKDLYQELGLSGQPELRLSRQPAKFGNLQYKKLLFLFCIMSISNVFVTTVVTIPLLAKNFTVESKAFKRVFWCLKNHQLELQFSWIMMWKPHSIFIAIFNTQHFPLLYNLTYIYRWRDLSIISCCLFGSSRLLCNPV